MPVKQLDMQPVTDDELEEPQAATLDTQDVPIEAPPVPTGDDLMVLRMPRKVPYVEGFEFPEGNLDFGPAPKHAAAHDTTNIKFTANGDGDGYAIVRRDHPLLPALMRKYPQVEMVESNQKAEAYVCEVCGREYKTKPGLLNHKLTH